MNHFEFSKHLITGEPIVEVQDEKGKLLCVIYLRPNGIRVLSRLIPSLDIEGDDHLPTDLSIDF